MKPGAISIDIQRIVGLSDEELSNLRGAPCPVDDCEELDCPRLCERCGTHHGFLLDVRPGVARNVCQKCRELKECASCGTSFPAWQTTVLEGDRHCSGCCDVEPAVSW